MLWYVQLSLPSPKSKSRSVLNQNGFNGKNETTHCSNKKSARNSCNLPLQPPHIILLHTFATAETLKYNDRKSNESLFDLLMFFGQNERNTMKKQIINSIFTKPSKHYVFSLAQPLAFSLFSCWSIFAIYQAGFFRKKGN